MNWIKSALGFGGKAKEPAKYDSHNAFKANGELYILAKEKGNKNCL